MSYQVTLQPSGRRFIVEGRETVLEAGLRSGINLAHGCANGSCGQCALRLVSGAIDWVRQPDRHHPLAGREDLGVPACCVTPATDLVVAVSEADNADAIPHQTVATRVARLDWRRDDLLILQLRTPRQQTLRFLAGQRAHLELPDGTRRRLHLANCPCDGLNLRFHLRLRDGDPFAVAAAALRHGDRVILTGPEGRFTLDEASRRPLLLVAYEEGFAPIQSLIEHVIAQEPIRPIRLLRIATGGSGLYLGNYCRSLVDGLDEFGYTALEVAPDQAADALFGWLAHQPDAAAHDLMLALPPALARAVSPQLAARGLTSVRITELDEPVSPG